MEKFWENLKQHPYMIAGGVVIGLILLYWIFSSQSATPAATTSSDSSDQTQAATQLAMANAQYQSADYLAAQQASTATNYYASQQDIAQIQANANTSIASLSAGSSNLYTQAQENVANNQITANQNQNEYISYLETEASLAGTAAQVSMNQAALNAQEFNTSALVQENSTNNATQLATNTAILTQENNQMYSNERVIADLITDNYLQSQTPGSNNTAGLGGISGIIGAGAAV